ncbi:hypothetical protein M406DRAFT_265518 [Cryphonectria parasitica EP155]|uniref:Uncharacterized protein n=1 Tax=Cryphonectria parasitica (strain ATCC 38755 / EP155) TaxID=660469 RepID=A0A9P4XVQ3_CRYP1|nr:uncharacterized protein M406DRAFT_265518 [Cryphonectria parasitica EP155]KAF3761682.1 hypothetical protein M406DRAFT_265518 [Cryphonectria parasitica EP155]
MPLNLGKLIKWKEEALKNQIKKYQEKIGSILYTAIMIRLDIAFAYTLLSRFLTNLEPKYLE